MCKSDTDTDVKKTLGGEIVNRFIVSVGLFLLIPVANAGNQKDPQSTIPYVKEAECINLIASLALVNHIMGQIATAMLGRYPACEVVSIMREAQRLAVAEDAARGIAKDVGSAYGKKAVGTVR